MGRKLLLARRDSGYRTTYLPALDGRIRCTSETRHCAVVCAEARMAARGSNQSIAMQRRAAAIAAKSQSKKTMPVQGWLQPFSLEMSMTAQLRKADIAQILT